MSRGYKILIVLIVLILISAGIAYWYMFFYGPGNTVTPVVRGTFPTTGFSPIGGTQGSSTAPNGSLPVEPSGTQGGSPATGTTTIETPVKGLRLLSDVPVGGYGASTTASSTVVRWVDRGRGNIYESKSDSTDITTLSNTVLPKIYKSVWDKNLTSFIGTMFTNNSETLGTVYAKLNIQATSTKVVVNNATTTASSTIPEGNQKETNITPYLLKGKSLPENMIDYAVSPKGDKLFMFIKENNQGVGYTANFDGTTVVKIFTTPVTQANVEWPEENTIAITTKGSASYNGYLYFVNPKTGIWKKILGPIVGLSTKTSRDAKYILASGTAKNDSIVTNLYTVGTSTPRNAVIRTLAEKCAWGNFRKEFLYCAESAELIPATYPDAWYRGEVGFADRIWRIDAKTLDIEKVTPLYNEADRLIDAINLGLDPKDQFLYFINKNDLSFWSFDLSR